MLVFKSMEKRARVIDSAGNLVEYEFEQRWDPLTGETSMICPHLKEKFARLYSDRDEGYLEELVEESRENCIFCKPLIDKIVAKFPDGFPDGLLKSNGVYVFPNLFPRTEFEAVVTCPEKHFLRLNEFTSNLLLKFFKASFECMHKAVELDPSLEYGVVGCNYLFPAGASLFHLHFQISMRDTPFSRVARLIDGSNRFKELNNENFWEKLVEEGKDREIKRGRTYWFVPFAPRGFSEVRMMLNKPSLLDVNERELEEISLGLSNILTYYNDAGFSSFNFALFSGGFGASELPVMLTLCARPNPRPNYLNIDSWYMPFLLGETIVLEKPEALAKKLRAYF